MKEILKFALEYLPLLLVPAVGFVFMLMILRIKRRYINEGRLFGHSSSPPDNCQSMIFEGEDWQPAESPIDLEMALRRIHELAAVDGNLGSTYWYEVGRLLQGAVGMQAEIYALSRNLEQCRAMLREAS